MEKSKMTVTMPMYEYESLVEAASTDFRKKSMKLLNEVSQLSMENAVLKSVITDYEQKVQEYENKRKWWQIWKR